MSAGLVLVPEEAELAAQALRFYTVNVTDKTRNPARLALAERLEEAL